MRFGIGERFPASGADFRNKSPEGRRRMYYNSASVRLSGGGIPTHSVLERHPLANPTTTEDGAPDGAKSRCAGCTTKVPRLRRSPTEARAMMWVMTGVARNELLWEDREK